MLCFPNCKINIGLYVTAKRDDGYHDIETVFYPLQVNDILEIVPASALQLHQTGNKITGGKEDNLVYKAYSLLHEKCRDKIKPVEIYLHKLIPSGAGLGGGSSDGAHMLRLLNDFFGLNMSNELLAGLAMELGSDCPFFIKNTPQFATGRGERMAPISIDLSAYSIQLVCPHIHVSTGKAFSMITPRPAPFDLRRVHSVPSEQWRNLITNDFEAPVFEQYPVLNDIKQQLYAGGAVFASMSGSGSALFGIFKKDGKAPIDVPLAYDSYYI